MILISRWQFMTQRGMFTFALKILIVIILIGPNYQKIKELHLHDNLPMKTIWKELLDHPQMNYSAVWSPRKSFLLNLKNILWHSAGVRIHHFYWQTEISVPCRQIHDQYKPAKSFLVNPWLWYHLNLASIKGNVNPSSLLGSWFSLFDRDQRKTFSHKITAVQPL